MGALAILRDMSKTGATPGEATIASTMKAFAAKGDTAQVLDLMEVRSPKPPVRAQCVVGRTLLQMVATGRYCNLPVLRHPISPVLFFHLHTCALLSRRRLVS